MSQSEDKARGVAPGPHQGEGPPGPAATAEVAVAIVEQLKRNQAAARKIVANAYPFACCAVCGLQVPTCLQIAHLDQNAANNSPENLARLCPTHHWMYDADLYPVEAIRLMQSRWQETKGVPNHKARMKDAGPKAAAKRKENRAKAKRSDTAKKAVKTRQARAAAEKAKQHEG